jgi:hypothetical protein
VPFATALLTRTFHIFISVVQRKHSVSNQANHESYFLSPIFFCWCSTALSKREERVVYQPPRPSSYWIGASNHPPGSWTFVRWRTPQPWTRAAWTRVHPVSRKRERNWRPLYFRLVNKFQQAIRIQGQQPPLEAGNRARELTRESSNTGLPYLQLAEARISKRMNSCWCCSLDS